MTGGPARRAVLAAAALTLPVAAAACGKGIGGLGTPPRPLPDVAVLEEAITSETLLIARYQEVFSRLPSLAAPLGSLLGQHRAHRDRLRAYLVQPRPGPSPRPSPPKAPGTSQAAMAYLRNAEQAAAASLLRHLSVAPPSLAQLLASIAASETTHAVALAASGAAG